MQSVECRLHIVELNSIDRSVRDVDCESGECHVSFLGLGDDVDVRGGVELWLEVEEPSFGWG